MKKALTIGSVVAALAATLTFVAASSKTGSGVESAALPDAPTPAQTTPYAVMAQNAASANSYDRGPRIIIVPQARDERVSSRASVDTRRHEDDDDDLAPRRDIAPPVRATPRWAPRAEPPRDERPYVPPRRVEAPAKHRSEPRTETRSVRHIDMSKPKAKIDLKIEPTLEAPIPQPPSPRRAVLSAPPPPADGPTPIRPMPRFDNSLASKAQSLGSKAEAPASPAEPAADLNDSPPPADITADQPPPGYTPPAAMREKSGDKY